MKEQDESPMAKRFLSKVRITESGCWQWTGARRNKYGAFALAHRTIVYAHRFSYEMFKGKIPEGLIIDHLCRTPMCVNPSHLEAVTYKENTHRGVYGQQQFCKHGHPLQGDNILTTDGRRRCKTCRRERVRNWRERTKNVQRIG